MPPVRHPIAAAASCCQVRQRASEKSPALSPVPVGSRVRGSGELISAEEVKGCVQAVVRVTVEIEGSDRPGCVIDTISRYYPEEQSG